jgi:hypothetical protein
LNYAQEAGAPANNDSMHMKRSAQSIPPNPERDTTSTTTRGTNRSYLSPELGQVILHAVVVRVNVLERAAHRCNQQQCERRSASDPVTESGAESAARTRQRIERSHKQPTATRQDRFKPETSRERQKAAWEQKDTAQSTECAHTLPGSSRSRR